MRRAVERRPLRRVAGGKLRVVALVQARPDARELWTLSRLASAPCRLAVLQARRAPILSQKLERVGAAGGLFGVALRLLGSGLLAPVIETRERARLERLFDLESLERWWRTAKLEIQPCTHLAHQDARARLAALAPDVTVCVSGGAPRRELLSVPRLATLDLHPADRGQPGILWGIVEGRRDWIGAAVRSIDEGVDSGTVLWQGGAQVAPGDTGEELLFRSHLEAVDALVDILRVYASGETPSPWPVARGASADRSAPGAGTWLKYLWLGRGTRARVTLEGATRC